MQLERTMQYVHTSVFVESVTDIFQAHAKEFNASGYVAHNVFGRCEEC